MLPTGVLSTERLILRPIAPEHKAAILSLISEREVARNLLRVPHPYFDHHFDEFMAQMAKSTTDAVFSIFLRDEERLCGGIGLHPAPEHHRGELGYWLGIPFWGRGYATEAARAVVGYAFETLKLHRIYAGHFSGNEASGRVLEKIGMKFEGRQIQHVFRLGEYRDLVLYGVTKKD
ncbi:MAG: GNAT family N-acetyltransferase [Acidobacteriaceae bacterium]|nr:GNAT family N-acetyltransferase [Acidobacteriaceae bacterium]